MHRGHRVAPDGWWPLRAAPGWSATGHRRAGVDAAAPAAHRDGGARVRRARDAHRSGGPVPAAGRRRPAAATAAAPRAGFRWRGAAAARRGGSRRRDGAAARTDVRRRARAGPTGALRAAGPAPREGPAVRGARAGPRRPGADAYAGTGAPRRRRPAPGLLVATAGAEARDGRDVGGARPSGIVRSRGPHRGSYSARFGAGGAGRDAPCSGWGIDRRPDAAPARLTRPSASRWATAFRPACLAV